MQKRFYFNRTGVTFTTAILTPGFLMIATAFIGFDSIGKLILSLAVGVGVLVVMWLGFARGTYVTIDESNNLYGTLFFFFRGRTIPLKDATTMTTRETFAGGVTVLYLTFRKKDGTEETRSFAAKQAFKKKDLKSLLEAIHSANPNIDTAQPSTLLSLD